MKYNVKTHSDNEYQLCEIGQGSNYLFRSDLRRFREKLQQLEGMRECFKPPIGGLGPKCYPNARK